MFTTSLASNSNALQEENEIKLKSAQQFLEGSEFLNSSYHGDADDNFAGYDSRRVADKGDVFFGTIQPVMMRELVHRGIFK